MKVMDHTTFMNLFSKIHHMDESDFCESKSLWITKGTTQVKSYQIVKIYNMNTLMEKNDIHPCFFSLCHASYFMSFPLQTPFILYQVDQYANVPPFINVYFITCKHNFNLFLLFFALFYYVVSGIMTQRQKYVKIWKTNQIIIVIDLFISKEII